MSLKPCRECGIDVSTEAASCPHCGIPRPAQNRPPIVSQPTASSNQSPLVPIAKALVLVFVAGVLIRGYGSLGVTLTAIAFVLFIALLSLKATRVAFILYTAGLLLVMAGGLGWRAYKVRARIEEQQNAEQKQRAEELARVRDSFDVALLATDWERIGHYYNRAKDLDPNQPDLTARWDSLQPQYAIFVTRSVINNPRDCESPERVGVAWRNLRDIPPSLPEFTSAKQLVGALERCRKRAAASVWETQLQLEAGERERIASRMEIDFLDNGFDADVRLSGREKRRMTIASPLIGRVTIHNLVKDGTLLRDLGRAGFERVTFLNDLLGQWHYDMYPSKTDPTAALGLDEPFVLSGQPSGSE